MGVRITGSPPNKNVWTKYAKGNGTTPGNGIIQVNGLNFRPQKIVIQSRTTDDIQLETTISSDAVDLFYKQTTQPITATDRFQAGNFNGTPAITQGTKTINPDGFSVSGHAQGSYKFWAYGA